MTNEELRGLLERATTGRYMNDGSALTPGRIGSAIAEPWPEDIANLVTAVFGELPRLLDAAEKLEVLVKLAPKMRSEMRTAETIQDPYTQLGMYRGLLGVLLGEIEDQKGTT